VEVVLAALDAASVPAGRIDTVADIAADPHYAACGMLQEVQMPDGSRLTVPGIVPKLSATPGSHRRSAPTMQRIHVNEVVVTRGVGLANVIRC
jgi:formyl-CoA transferase